MKKKKSIYDVVGMLKAPLGVSVSIEEMSLGYGGKFKEGDAVSIRCHSSGLDLACGTIGVVVHVHGQGDAYEVEFLREDGSTIGVETFAAADLDPSVVQDIQDLPVQERKSLKGMSSHAGKAVSITEMNAVIAARSAAAVRTQIQMQNPPHPGEVLKEYLGSLSLADAAEKIGIDQDGLSRLLAGQSRIDRVIAAKLGRAFGTSAQLWVGLQSAFDASNPG
nr:HigA family addiction module antitoxin [Rhodoferax sp.]